MKALKEITAAEMTIESILSKKGGDYPNAAPPMEHQPIDQSHQAGEAKELAGAFMELAQDISINLRGLLRVQEERLDKGLEQQRELILAARSIEKTLAELADTLATLHPASK